MSFLNPWGIFTGGIDLEEEQKRGDKADADLAAINRESLERGNWDQDKFDEIESYRLSRNTQGIEVEKDVLDAAKEGAVDGLISLPAKVRGGLNSAFGFTFGFFPWWLYVAALGGIFWYLGGFLFLRGILARKK